MTSADWIRLAADIEANYSAFDGFVILHGTGTSNVEEPMLCLMTRFTDTMAYTSSALSFLLEDLGKTVIVTGAQVPIGQMRNDAVENCLNSIILAGTYVIPGKKCIGVRPRSISNTPVPRRGLLIL